MRTLKQTVFITTTSGVTKVFDARSDAMRETGGNRAAILARAVIQDSDKGPYRKPKKKRSRP